MGVMPTLAVLSMKGGVGKTTVTLGLASAALHRDLRVLVIDLDPQGNASMGMDVLDAPFTMNDVLADPRPGIAEQAVVTSPWSPNLHVLAADRSLEHRNVPQGPHSSQRLRIALANLPMNYDLVLLDCPPSLGEMTRNALHSANAAAIVTDPSYFALHGAEQALEAVQLVRDAANPSLRKIAIVVNKARTTLAEHRFRIAELQQAYGDAVSETMVPERQAIAQAEGAGMPIHSWQSPAGVELTGIFGDLLDEFMPRKPVFRWGGFR